MKASIISAAAVAAAPFFFFGSALAAPSTGSFAYRSVPAPSDVWFNIQLSNDISGHNAQAAVSVNAPAVPLGALFTNPDGSPIFATALQAVNPGVGGGNVVCSIVDPASAGNAYPLNARQTYVDFDRNGSVATQIDVTKFTISCKL